MRNQLDDSRSEVKIVRIANGEILISCVEKLDDSVILERPYVIISSGNGIAIANWIPFCSDTKVEVSLKHVMYIADPDGDLSSQYGQTTGKVIVPKTVNVRPMSIIK